MISILIIGNEILSHQIEDQNLKVMLAELNEASYPIDEVRIIRDEVPIISQAIRELSARSQFVISSGGVGPTHDDLTFEAYADAFESPLHVHEDLEMRMRRWFGDQPLKESALRMARIPEVSELIDLGPKSWPLIKVANCFVLPGLPEVFIKKFRAVLDVLPPVPRRLKAALYTKSDETAFAATLTEIQQRFEAVEIGSYPTYNREEFAAYVTLKSTDRLQFETAYQQLLAMFEKLGTLVRVDAPE